MNESWSMPPTEVLFLLAGLLLTMVVCRRHYAVPGVPRCRRRLKPKPPPRGASSGRSVRRGRARITSHESAQYGLSANWYPFQVQPLQGHALIVQHGVRSSGESKGPCSDG